MKISYTWLLDYLYIQDKQQKVVVLTPERIADILTEVGLEVEELEPYESVKGGLEGLVIGEVLTVAKHPDADKLSLTTVSLGGEMPVSIVCGAPNVAAGQKVVVAPVDCTIYPTKGESFTIRKAKIRGQESHGMICAEDEIGLGESHAGIMVLPADAPVGMAAADYFGVFRDWLIDIALTPNRSDAMSHIGVARDLVAYLNINTAYTASLRLPEHPAIQPAENSLPLTVTVQAQAACPRYSGIVLDGLTVQPSPAWMQHRLMAIGVKPINNVVDVTNFVLHEMGQPLHAFDYAHIQGGQVVVKMLPSDTPFITLDGDERKLHAEDLMICDAEQGMCIAGVYGGKGSGVSATTQQIFLESAYFHPTYIRKTALRHQLRTDAAMHFEKGIDPNLTIPAMQRAVYLLAEIAGGQVASGVFDCNPNPVQPAVVHLKDSYITTMAGEPMAQEVVTRTLTSLGMGIERTADGYQITVPTYKTDVNRPADVMEELLRLYGYNNIVTGDVMHPSLSVHAAADVMERREKIANWLAAGGAMECQNLTFAAAAQLDRTGLTKHITPARLLNPLSAEMDVLRPHLLPGLLQSAARNINHRNADLQLFEFGNGVVAEGEEFTETMWLGLLLTGQLTAESWEAQAQPVQFYHLKQKVRHLLSLLGLTNLQEAPASADYLDYGLDLLSGDNLLGSLGLVQPSIAKAFDIKRPIYFAQLNWNAIEQLARQHRIQFTDIARFPAMRRDLALVIDRSVTWQQLEALALREGGKYLQEVGLFDTYEDERLGNNKISYAMRFIFQDKQATLTDKPVDKAMQHLMDAFHRQFDATIRQ